MAYTPINWQTGQTITAEKLNKMDNGWSVVESSEVLYEGNVTTTPDGDFNSGDIGTTITAPTIKMTFDGSVYNLNQWEDDGDIVYGGLEDYPFVLFSDGYFLTNEAGTFTVKIETPASTTIEISADFGKARGYWSDLSLDTLYNGFVTTVLDGGVYSGDIGTTITAPTIKMTFDGSVYNLNQLEDDGDIFYGGLEDYPFVLYSDGYFLTNEAGTFTVKIEVESTVTETSEDFTQAVQSVSMSGTPFMMTVGETTYDEFTAAKAAGRPCFLTYSNYMAFVGYSTPNGVNNDVVIAPTMSGVTFRFNSNDILEAVES